MNRNYKKKKQGNLKTKLRNKRRRRNLLAVFALIIAAVVVVSILLMMLAFANTIVERYNNTEMVYSEGSLSFMSKMYETSTTDPVTIRENEVDRIHSPLVPEGTYTFDTSGSDNVIEDVESKVNESTTSSQVNDEEWAPYPVEAGPYPYLTLTKYEKEIFAILIYLESGAEPLECQYACASVVINRFTTSDYDSILDIIYAEGQFQPAYLIENYSARQEQLEIVDWLCEYGPTIPEYVTYFRDDYYHTWSNLKPWKTFRGNLSDMYFSYSPKLYDQWLADR